MNASDYIERAVLNQFFRSQTQPTPSAVFVALYISNPTDADTGTEVSGGGYARRQVTFGEVAQISGKGQISNSTKIEFPVATSAWGSVAYFGIRDATNGGNLLAWGPLSQTKDVQSGDQIVIQFGDLSVTLD
jgi:hypothetical protein